MRPYQHAKGDVAFKMLDKLNNKNSITYTDYINLFSVNTEQVPFVYGKAKIKKLSIPYILSPFSSPCI